MEIIAEVLFELIFEGTLEIAGNKKVSKWIRYPAIVLLSLFLICSIGLLLFMGISILLKGDLYSIIGGLFIILIGIVITYGIIMKYFRR